MFYCLVEGTYGCKKTHGSVTAAFFEASRLALLPENIGKKVYVLEARGYYKVPKQPPEWVDFRTTDVKEI